MAENLPREHAKRLSSLPASGDKPRERLSFRGKWILLAVCFSLAVWALLALAGIRLFSP